MSMLPVKENGTATEDRVVTVDFNLLQSTQLLYNKAYGRFVGLRFMNNSLEGFFVGRWYKLEGLHVPMCQ